MKYALLADVHANLEALQAVLAHSKEKGCTNYAFLGDYVGYCADPRACLDIVRALNAPCIKGNHDEYCSSDGPLEGFTTRGANHMEWTRKQLRTEDREWLRSLPFVLRIENFTIVHATLDGPERWGYVFDRLAAAASLVHQKTDLCFFAHTHVPVVFTRDNVVRGGTYTRLSPQPGKKYFVNVGSVGQPRDDNPNAAYVTHDLDQEMIELHRVPFDIETAQRKIREAELGN